MVKGEYEEIYGEKKEGFFEKVKDFFADSAKEFLKTKFEETKEDAKRTFERKVMRKVRREIKKAVTNVFLVLFLALGVGFLIYGGLSLLIVSLALPEYVTPMLFGLFLVLVGFVVKIIG
ncbi:MAG: hypothetical protein ACOCXG_04660 [Nanoarchaeota archaeon]